MNSANAVISTIALAAILISAPLSAEIYKSVDKDGNVTYTDRKLENGEEVNIKRLNRTKAVATPAKSQDDQSNEAEKTQRYSRLKISSPKHDSAIEHGPGDFTVTVQIRPKLANGHKIQLYLDGQAHGEAVAGTSFELSNIFRGTHTLQVKIVDKQGKTLKKSSITDVHVFRPSVLSPGYRG